MKVKITKGLAELAIVSGIFLSNLNGFYTFYLQSIHDNGKYADNYFTNHDFPLHANIDSLIWATVFLLRIIFLSACKCTQIMGISHFSDQLYTVILIFTGYNEILYYRFIYPLYFTAITGLFVYYIIGKILTYYKLK